MKKNKFKIIKIIVHRVIYTAWKIKQKLSGLSDDFKSSSINTQKYQNIKNFVQVIFKTADHNKENFSNKLVFNNFQKSFHCRCCHLTPVFIGTPCIPVFIGTPCIPVFIGAPCRIEIPWDHSRVIQESKHQDTADLT